MKSIYPSCFDYIRRKQIKKMWSRIKDRSPIRDLKDVNAIRVVAGSPTPNQTERYYKLEYRRYNSVQEQTRKPLPYHFVIDGLGRISQHRGINRIAKEKNEIVIAVWKNKPQLNKKESHALKSIVRFFRDEVDNIFWEIPEWARYTVESNELEDEFEQLWKDNVPRSGEITLDDFKNILKILYIKK